MSKLVSATPMMFGLLCFVSVALSGSRSFAGSIGQQERQVTRIDLIHYVSHFEAHSAAPATSSKVSCVELIGTTPLSLPWSYVVNPGNNQGLAESQVLSAIISGADAWSTPVKRTLFAEPRVDYGAPTYPRPDSTNTVAFSDMFPDTSVLAQTSLYFSDDALPLLVEFDVLLNNKLPWGDAALDPNVFDIQAIITHELGHTLCLGDITDVQCSAVTMYLYSNSGETDRRTPEKVEVKALRKLLKDVPQVEP